MACRSTVAAGETLALVGESGCGKSTVGRLALRLIEPTAGTVRLDGRDLASLSGAELRRARAGAQLIFQDPYGSLNPRMTVGEMLAEPLLLHTDLSPASRRERVAELLRVVGLKGEHVAALPARVLGRPAPAHRHRPRAGGRAQTDRLRRARIGPRRLHPQPDPEPAQGPAAAPGARLRLHQPRPGGGEAHRHARGRDVSRAHRRERRRAMQSSPSRAIPTRRRCCLRCRCCLPASASAGTSCRAIRQAQLDPPPGCHLHPRCAHAQDVCRSLTT